MLLLLLLFSQLAGAQEFSVKKGIVVDSLKISDTLQETFALYLPTHFEGKKPWPVLMIFDPKGRGGVAANFFRNTAEEQGYILVSSNNVKAENDLVENVQIASRLLGYTTQSLPIDFRQISTAGALDGAQVATSIPVIFNNILGVVAVGDQWVNLDLIDRKKDFAFIGVVGDEQFTSIGMDITSQDLRDRDLFTAVYSYPGNKEWPSPELINSAVGSLTLLAMKKELRPIDLQLVQKLYNSDISRVDKMISTGELVQAFDLLNVLEKKYGGLKDLLEIEQKQDQLKRSRNYLEQKINQERAFQKENRLANDFIYYFDQDVKNANFENLGWWNYQKITLDSLANKGGQEGKMANRLKGLVNEMVKQKRLEFQKKRTPLEIELFTNMLQTIFDPTNYKAYKKIISLSAQDNDFGTALFYLEEMLKHGFREEQELYNIEGTLGLKLTPEFNKIVKNYLGTSRYYDDQE